MPRSEPPDVRRIVTSRSPGGDASGGTGFRVHTHPRREIFFAVEGTCRYLLAGKVYEAAPGTAFLIDTWEPHAFGYRREDGGLRHFWLHFAGPGEPLTAVLLRVAPGGEYRLERSPFVLPPDHRNILERRWDALARGGDMTDTLESTLLTLDLEQSALMLKEMASLREQNVGEDNPRMIALRRGYEELIEYRKLQTGLEEGETLNRIGIFTYQEYMNALCALVEKIDSQKGKEAKLWTRDELYFFLMPYGTETDDMHRAERETILKKNKEYCARSFTTT